MPQSNKKTKKKKSVPAKKEEPTVSTVLSDTAKVVTDAHPTSLGGIQEDLHASHRHALNDPDHHGVDFVTIVSHQLRTPLTAIKWYVDLLLSGKAGEVVHQQRDFLLDIYQSNERMIRLVDNLLIIEQLERRSLSMIPRTDSLTKLIRSIMEEYETYAKVNNIVLIYQGDDAHIKPAKIDSIYMRLAIKNLIDNALRYTEKRGTVTVSCEMVTQGPEKQEMVQVSVSDTGIGIPDDEREKVFGKFYRSARSLAVQTEGTGLGLYIAKVIIEKNNGTIWFEPKDPGTVFYVQLPASNES